MTQQGNAPHAPDSLDTGRLAWSVTEAAQRVGLSRRTLYREHDAGRIQFVRIGRRVVVTEAELRRFLAAQAAEPIAS